jgi:Zn-dependent metalloprotease
MRSRTRPPLLSTIASAALLHAGMTGAAVAQATTTHHPERGTPRLQILPPEQVRGQANLAPSPAAGAQEVPDRLRAAWRFLSEHATEYGLTPDLSSLEHVGTQTAKEGTIFRFKQRLGGYRVEGGEIVVSVNDQDQIYQVYNNIYPVTADKVARATEDKIGQDRAIDVAWSALGAQGFVAEPQAELKYLPLSDPLADTCPERGRPEKGRHGAGSGGRVLRGPG